MRRTEASDGKSRFFVEMTALAPGPRNRVLRGGLELIASGADRFECDLPLPDGLPADVLEARTYLELAGKGSPVTGTIPSTGLLAPQLPLAWSSFLAFSPYALDGHVWSATFDELAGFGDEAGYFYLRLRPEQFAELSDLVDASLITRQ